MQENNHILADERVGRLLVSLSTPAMIGMFVMALYNVVDTIFVGRGVGTMAIAGIAIVFPIQMVVMAIAQMLGIGGAAIISMALGAGDDARASKTYGNVLLLVVVFGVLMAMLGNIFIDELLRIFGASDTILPYAKDYASIILYGTVFFSFAMTSNSIVRSEGRAKVAMNSMLVSAVLNIILDPIFIFGFGWGVKGAAEATVISQFASVIYLVVYFSSGKSSLKVSRRDLFLERKIVTEILAIGSASFLRQISTSIMAVFMNHILRIYGGDLSIAIFGIMHRILMFVSMPIFGIAQGLQPITGFNYGAKRYEKAKRALRLSIQATTGIGISGALIIVLFPRALLSLFSTDQNLISIGVRALRIFILALPFAGFQVVGSTLFQAIGKARQALGLTVSRQVVLIGLVFILSRWLQLDGIWVAFPLSDVLFFFVVLALYIPQLREFDAHIAARKRSR
jgi:putative MATE family efflux protein